MKKIKVLVGFFGLILPVSLTLLNNGANSCQVGPLHFLRGANAYITVHGPSYDYNNNAKVDYTIIFAVTLILLAVAFAPPKNSSISTLLGRIILIILIGIVEFGLVTFIGLGHCLTF
jgi:hypothetical protein